MGEVEMSVINGTQESLGKWLKKPPLTEKLLRKPPFKFLHDIITGIIDTTGFMRDVYQPDELKSDNIKDRDAKIEFLQKAVDHVALVTGKTPTLRPNKTVAGHEADRTNLFLQTLAQAIQLHKEQLESDGVTKEKTPSVKSPIKKSGERDKRELLKSNSKEKLLKTTNGVDSPKGSPGRRKPAADEGRPDRTSKSKSERDGTSRSTEKTTKSRAPAENGESRRGGGSKDRTHEKNRAGDGSSGETKKAVSKERNSKDRNNDEARGRVENGIEKEKSRSKDKSKEGRSGKDVKESTKERKDDVKDRKGTTTDRRDSTKNRKENTKETKDSAKERKDVSKERKESSKDRKESSRDRKESSKEKHDREKRDSGVDRTSKESRRSSVSRPPADTLTSAILSPKRISNVQKESAGEKILGSPKSSAILTNENGALDSREPAVTSGLSQARPSTARLGSGDRTNSAVRPQRVDVPPPSNDEATATPPQQRQDPEPDGETIKRPTTSTIRKASARPSTARPAAPKVRVVGTAQEEPPSNEPVLAVSNIILDKGDAKDDDEDDGFRVEESESVLVGQDQSSEMDSADDSKRKEHGSLVTQILDTKKDLEMGSLRPVTGFRGANIDRQPVSDSTKRKERELLCREMDRLREGVQTVTRCANPLGKLVDYLQEDVDTMLKELDTWRSESHKYETSLQREQSKTNLELESLQNKLQEVEEAIDAQGAKICAVKANILRNEERIQKMMSPGRP